MNNRYALIIGNSTYRDPKLSQLKTPDVDVSALCEVLNDPRIGGFDKVQQAVNASSDAVRRAISKFFSNRNRDDTLLLYFSGHGVLDENGKLYLAVEDTEYELTHGTAIPASFIREEMENCRSQRQVLVLDCCHSGAFARGSKGALGSLVGTGAVFEGSGYGHVVLTASDATQYAWEDDNVTGDSPNSLFTHYLVEGLKTGAADLGHDGKITADELFDYVYERVVRNKSNQTPAKWSYKEHGDIVLAEAHPSKPPEQNTEESSIVPANSYLIVTVTKTESQAVLEILCKGSLNQKNIGDTVYYDLGRSVRGPVLMVQSEMGIATPGGALITLSHAIQDIKPQAVIMCGIAFGMHPDKQQIGDILVSKQIQYYEPQKLDLKHGEIPRGDRVTASDRLLALCRGGELDWQSPAVHFGLILSGEKLVNTPVFRDKLQKIEPEAIGGEMEGAGLYTAARNAKTDWIVVKAICDWADGKKNDGAQQLAARNAAKFVAHVLKLDGWNKQQGEPIKRSPETVSVVNEDTNKNTSNDPPPPPPPPQSWRHHIIFWGGIGAAAIVIILAVFLGLKQLIQQSPPPVTPVPTQIAAVNATASAAVTSTTAASAVPVPPTWTATPILISTATDVPTATWTIVPTSTATIAPTPTDTPVPTRTPTPKPTWTSSPTVETVAATFSVPVGPKTPVPAPAAALSPENAGGMVQYANWPMNLSSSAPMLNTIFTPDGKSIIIPSAGSAIWVRSARDGSLVQSLQGHSAPVNAMAISADGSTLASVADDGTARLWNLKTGEQIKEIHVYTAIHLVALSPDGKYLAAAAVYKLWLWDTTDWDWRQGFENPDAINALAFSPDSKTLAIADTKVRLMTVPNLTVRRDIQPQPMGRRVAPIAYSPDGSFLVTAFSGGPVQGWQPANSEPVGLFFRGTSSANLLAISPDRSLLAVGYYDKSLLVWDIANPSKPLFEKKFDEMPMGMMFSPDGKYLAVTSKSGMQLWGAKP